jgi:hypothetical protein
MKNEQAYIFAAKVIFPIILVGFGVVLLLARRHQRRPLFSLLIFSFGLFPFIEYWQPHGRPDYSLIPLVTAYVFFLFSAVVAGGAMRREAAGRGWCGLVLFLNVAAMALPFLVSPAAMQAVLGW